MSHRDACPTWEHCFLYKGQRIPPTESAKKVLVEKKDLALSFPYGKTDQGHVLAHKVMPEPNRPEYRQYTVSY